MNKNNQNVISIDKKHDEMLDYFNNNDDIIIPNLQTEKSKLINEIKELSKSDVDTYMELKDKINEIKNKIKELKREKKKYYIDNSNYIFQYFEEKKSISNGENSQNKNVLNTFFKIKSNDEKSSNVTSDKYKISRISYSNYWKKSNHPCIFTSYINVNALCKMK